MKLSDLFLEQREWLEVTHGKNKFKLLVNSLDCDAYRQQQDRIVELANSEDAGDYDPVHESRRNVAAHLLVDWDGVEDNDGNPVTYDANLAVDLFKANSALFAKVVNKARDIQERNDSVYDDTRKK